MEIADRNLYLVICDPNATSYVDKEFLVKMGAFKQYVRIGETSWLIYTRESLDDVCLILHDIPECEADIKVDEFTTLTSDKVWKDEVIFMMKTLYKKQMWLTN
ncbi:MAG TPA: hypothetical protein VEC36_08810 [Patescibacteria group bacterium]|nr:hypothetical protein [Patescibacteria group bacterium]